MRYVIISMLQRYNKQSRGSSSDSWNHRVRMSVGGGATEERKLESNKLLSDIKLERNPSTEKSTSEDGLMYGLTGLSGRNRLVLLEIKPT